MPQSEITEVIPVCNRVNKNFQKKKEKKMGLFLRSYLVNY